MKELFIEFRMYLAEKILMLALNVASKDSPDTVVMSQKIIEYIETIQSNKYEGS